MNSKSVAQHTPAPWERRSIPGHLFEVTSNGNPVLRIRGGMMPTLEDARLIAAAPELLEALERIIDDLPNKRDWLDPQIEALAQAAICKAKGEL